MKYKTGDKVRIKSDLKVGMEYDNWELLPMMEKYLGKELIIQTVLTEFYLTDGNCFSWTDEMIEGLVEEEKVKLEGEDPMPLNSHKYIRVHDVDKFYPKDENIVNVNSNDTHLQTIVERDKYHEYLMKASIAAMQGICSNQTFINNLRQEVNDDNNLEKLVSLASIDIAKQLLTQLKLEQK